MEDKGHHFVFDLLKFVFGTVGRCELPVEIQNWFTRYRPDTKGPFNGKIINALIISIVEYKDNSDKLANTSSQEFETELQAIASDEDFLKFVGRYSVKAWSEYSTGDLKSPFRFQHSITDFLLGISFDEGSVANFFKNWNLSAEKILKDAECLYQFTEDYSDVVDLTKEQLFIVSIMNSIFGILNAPEEMILEGGISKTLVTVNIEKALKLAVHHHKQFLLICDYDHLIDYYHKCCIIAFDEKDFLELCACYVGNVVANQCGLEASQNACDFLLKILEHAKKASKFTFGGLHGAARDLVEKLEKIYHKKD